MGISALMTVVSPLHVCGHGRDEVASVFDTDRRFTPTFHTFKQQGLVYPLLEGKVAGEREFRHG